MEPQKSSVGGIIGTIIIIALIILGGLYFWGKRIEESKAKENLVTDNSPTQTEVNEANSIRSVSSSDDINSIQADLDATNFNNMDTEVNSGAQY